MARLNCVAGEAWVQFNKFKALKVAARPAVSSAVGYIDFQTIAA